jgi:hypothetical protein
VLVSNSDTQTHGDGDAETQSKRDPNEAASMLQRPTVVRAVVHQRLVAEPERLPHAGPGLALPRGGGATELIGFLRQRREWQLGLRQRRQWQLGLRQRPQRCLGLRHAGTLDAVAIAERQVAAPVPDRLGERGQRGGQAGRSGHPAVLRGAGLVAGLPRQLPALVEDAHVALVHQLQRLQEVVLVGARVVGVPHRGAPVEHLQPVPREDERARVHRAHGQALRLPHAPALRAGRRRVQHLHVAEVGAEAAGAGGGLAAHEVGRVLARRRGQEQHGVLVPVRRDARQDLLLGHALDRARRRRRRRGVGRQQEGYREAHGKMGEKAKLHGCWPGVWPLVRWSQVEWK